MNNLDNDWENFLDDNTVNIRDETINNDLDNNNFEIPKSSPLYISTKTKITYLNVDNIDLYDVFWKIPILSYHEMKNGVIKKQMKFNLNSEEESNNINKKLEDINYYKVDIIHSNKINHGKTQIFKEVKKVNIGLCKKDIISYRSKQKSAFYNCFVVILRIKYNNIFKEIHVKVFNTGKVEIPGIQCDELYNDTLTLLIEILNNIITDKNLTIPEKNETVLINSNFRSGYYIDREKMYQILKYKYNINATYDACSYPGIQCKYHLNEKLKISFMVFRTGSILIVGKCEMSDLNIVYKFLVKMLQDEYSNVSICENIPNNNETDKKKTKVRKKVIYVNN